MNSCALLFCFFIGAGIVIGVHGLVKNHEQVAFNLLDETRWRKEVSEFTTGLQYKDDAGDLLDISIGRGIPPSSEVNAEDVKFLLYTRSNRYTPETLSILDPNSLQNSHFNHEKRTIFITHGWMNYGGSQSCTLIRDAYLRHYDVNVIVIDWSTISYILVYPRAAAKVPSVGSAVAIFINYLSHHGYIKVSDIILVGHSLGAHVVGIAAYIARGLPRAVFGLDPALPCFKFAAPGWRISDQDAFHVQTIHTNAGLLGTDEVWGHVSFLVNGGITQPGCWDPVGICSHSRAFEYFAESIGTTVGFHGGLCKTATELALGACVGPESARMGGFLPDETLEPDEIYTVPVNVNSPFAHGQHLQGWRPFGFGGRQRRGRLLSETDERILRS